MPLSAFTYDQVLLNGLTLCLNKVTVGGTFAKNGLTIISGSARGGGLRPPQIDTVPHLIFWEKIETL